MTSITLTAPAKVNLFLQVLNKRRDGYHNLQTLFERISLADKLTISKIPSGIEIFSDRFITRDHKNNLVYKAARSMLGYILEGKSGERGVRIRIKKRIPIAAGLGGGSSDAAATLTGINKLYNLKLSNKELLKLAGCLGADVPFFILRAPFAAGKGVGERLVKINSLTTFFHLIIYPGFKVATKDIYEAFDRTPRGLTLRRRSGSSPEHLPKGLTKGYSDVKISRILAGSRDLSSVESMLRNNLEDVVIAKRPVIGRIIERLALFLDKKAIVSGSGPSVFCLYRTRKEAIAARRRLYVCVPAGQRKGWQVFVARTEGAL